MNLAPLAAAAAFLWMVIILLPWRPWSTRESLDAHGGRSHGDLKDITILIPARNEAKVIGTTLAGVNAQGGDLRVIVIDDQSTDGTAAEARKTAGPNLMVISGEAPPEGWSGKLWALEQGLGRVETPLTLLLDADIELGPGILFALLKKLREEDLSFISLMASLGMAGFWERLLMPAFVYFFKLLYPFSLSNSPRSRMAAAAGGCILLETRVLKAIGGFSSIRGRLIDDCALAGKVKSMGYRTWMGLTRAVRSHRRHDSLETIWNMVARTAFTQLRYSTFLLALVSLIMVVMFWVPVAGLLLPGAGARLLSAAALLAMISSYWPILRYYSLPPVWALSMPLSATLYLAMTWTSAIRFWKGERSRWKGRSYTRERGGAG